MSERSKARDEAYDLLLDIEDADAHADGVVEMARSAPDRGQALRQLDAARRALDRAHRHVERAFSEMGGTTL